MFRYRLQSVSIFLRSFHTKIVEIDTKLVCKLDNVIDTHDFYVGHKIIQPIDINKYELVFAAPRKGYSSTIEKIMERLKLQEENISRQNLIIEEQAIKIEEQGKIIDELLNKNRLLGKKCN